MSEKTHEGLKWVMRAGYGARAWNNSEAKRELLEKFPEQVP